MIAFPLIYGAFLPIGNIASNRLADQLTDHENWKTHALHRRHLILKVFTFRFSTAFIPMFLFAIQQQDAANLIISIASYFIFSQPMTLITSVMEPLAWTWTRNRLLDAWWNVSPNRHRISQAWRQTAASRFDAFEVYTQLVVQFTFITCFSMAFPLAPICAIIYNLLCIRVYAWLLVHVCQRPAPRHSEGISAWLPVFNLVSFFSMLVNVALIGTMSKQVDAWFPGLTATNKILAIFLFEHVLLLARGFVGTVLPAFLPSDSEEAMTKPPTSSSISVDQGEV